MNDIVKTTRLSKADLQARLNTNANFSNVTGGLVLGIVAWLADKVLSSGPVGTSLLIIQAALKADNTVIASRLQTMAQNGYSYFVITSTYKYEGYMPGSSYPTYSLKTQTYRYE